MRRSVVLGMWMVLAALVVTEAVRGAARKAPVARGMPGATAAMRPARGMGATYPSTRPGTKGPEIVVLKELENLYQPVPFNHAEHAQMAEMWDGCTTCHHRSPNATTRPAETVLTAGHVKVQADAAEVPACKSCHVASVETLDIRMPNLKGAYHRQCLNCHREWARANQCSACHLPKEGRDPAEEDPTEEDIVGRMHPPIPEPDVKVYATRFTPAVGDRVTFRHTEHVGFGLRCVSCHHNDSCAHCHDPQADTVSLKPVRPGKTWKESHGPCVSCHQQDKCRHCHYRVPEVPPAAFAHNATGQGLDKDHAGLACVMCHADLRQAKAVGCGPSECHKKGAVTWPAEKPGPVAATQPSVAFEVQWTGTSRRIRQ